MHFFTKSMKLTLMLVATS